MTPPLDLLRFTSRLATMGLDAQLVAFHLMDTGSRKSLYELMKYFERRENGPEIHRIATALKARAARWQAKHDDWTREYYGAFELPPFPKRALSVVDGGVKEPRPARRTPHQQPDDHSPDGGRAA
jgi:hypothetical protein